MPDYLKPEELEALRRWPTCAIANAIELFNIRPRNQGFMLPEIKCVFPDLGPMIGYAVTAVITAESPDGRKVQPAEWWENMQTIPKPRVLVMHDLDEMRELGFHAFSSCVTVSHAYVHMVDMGIPVKVGGLVVKPGDLVVGDKHGVISVPLEIARDVPKAAQLVEDWERTVIHFCKSKEFTIDGLKERYNSPRPTWPHKK